MPELDVLPKQTVAAAPQTQNPSVAPGKTSVERQRVPMSVPVQRLEVPEIPGYHLHWINDYPGRVDAALDNGYEFVSAGEVGKTSFNVGATEGQIKHSVGVQENGDPLYAYLMKIRQEWYDEDQSAKSQREQQVDAAIKSGRNLTVKDAGETDKYYGEGSTKASDKF